MKFLPRAAAVLSAVVLGLTLTPAPASASVPALAPASALKVPGPPVSIPCGPSKITHYCFNPKFAAQAKSALKWSNNHRKKSERRPVPYPTTLIWDRQQTYHVVYQVRVHEKGKKPFIWKYGETRQVPWTKRAKQGRLRCSVYYGPVSPKHCEITWIGVSEAQHGYYWGRYLEASKIKQWNRKHGTRTKPCPKGQRFSCR